MAKPIFLPSLKQTRNIYAIGRNYVEHVRELSNALPERPVVFSKNPSTLTGSRALELPRALGEIHFELELVLRLGSDRAPGRLQSTDCISHMALGIDFTARALQSRLKTAGLPWFLAKNFQHACFVGPLCESFDLDRPFRFRLFQNDSPRQHGDSRHMIFDFLTMLKFINRNLPLQAGDLVFTGTPSGVGPVADRDVLRLVCPELDTDCRLEIRLSTDR